MRMMLLAASLCCAMCTEAAVLRLANGGRPMVRVQTMSADAAVIHAADEFIAYMNAILRRTDNDGASGALTLQLALAGDESCQAADALMATNGLDRARLGDEGFLVAEAGKSRVMLCAYSGKGVLNGVYRIFEKAFGTVAPRPLAGLAFPAGLDAGAKDIALPYADRPTFRIRGLGPCGQKWAHPEMPMWDWMARVGLNGRAFSMATYLNNAWAKEPYGFIDLVGGHSFLYWVPKREYFAAHPEYFSLIDGKRRADSHGAQLSLGNPEVIDLIVRRMLIYKAKHPSLSVLPFGYNDSAGGTNPFGWSEDPLDIAMDSPNDLPKSGSQRPRTWSTRYIKAANQIAERLDKVHPGLKLMVYAYHFIMLKPPDCPIHPNIVVEFAPLYMCEHHPLADPMCPRNRLFCEHLRGWAALTKNIYVRNYIAGANRHFPLVTLYTLKENMKLYRDLGLAGFSPETRADGPDGANRRGCDQPGRTQPSERAYEDFWDANALVHFALARLGWNPDEKVEDIVALFCRSWYGPKAGPEMAKYFLLMDENLRLSSHPGERNPIPETGDFVNFGAWCMCWNWKMPLTSWTKRLFRAEKAEDVEKNAMPLITAMYDARRAAAGDWLAQNRVDRDYELLKMYLLSFGYELYEFKQRQYPKIPPLFSAKGRGTSVEVE